MSSAHKASFAARVSPQAHQPFTPDVEGGDVDAVLHGALKHQTPQHHSYSSHHRSVTHLLTVLAPLIIGEMIHDANKRWRWIRMASVGTAVLGEVELCWQDRVRQREREEESRAR